MEREIKFRGISLSINEFVYGDLVTGVGEKKGKFYILPHETNFAYLKGSPHPVDGYEVYPDTVGQYIGLNDMKGEGWFRGDLTTFNHKIMEIIFIPEVASFQMYCHSEGFRLPIWECENGIFDLPRLGNIHSNPELLK